MEDVTITGKLNSDSWQNDGPSYRFDLSELSDYQALDLIADAIIKLTQGGQPDQLKKFFSPAVLKVLEMGVAVTLAESSISR